MQPGLTKEELPTNPAQSDVATENSEELEKPALIEEKEIKSELVEPKDITDRMDLEKQQDLFKAVFMSSDSESENEDDDDNKKLPEVKTEESRKEELKSAVLSDQLIPKIKPMKEGVLSGINFHKFSKPVPKESSGSEKVDEPNCYGPKIPEKIPAQLKQDITRVSSESDDEWIEKGASDSKKKKKHKKEKKHKKDKHRKHKHEKKSKYKE